MSAELEKEIERLLKELDDKDEQIEELMDNISDLEIKIESLEDDIIDSEAFNIESESEEDLIKELLSRSGADFSMVNEIKIEKFFENIDGFSLEKFEEFLKSLKPIP